MIFLLLFLEFFKIGLFCFGGAFGMIPLIEETVLHHGWLTESRFVDLIGVCESTPGPIAVNMATYIGSIQGGFLGSVVATLGVVLPSFLIILVIASILKNFSDNKYFKAFLKGVKPVVTALILSTGVIFLFKSLGFVSITNIQIDIVSLAIFSLLLLVYFLIKCVFKKKVSSIFLIALSAALGIGVSMLSENFIA